MFRSDDERRHTACRDLIRFGTTLSVTVLMVAQGVALAEEAPAYRSPPADMVPHSGPAVPGGNQAPGGKAGSAPDNAPGAGEQDGSRQPEDPQGCPYRDRPLNLLV